MDIKRIIVSRTDKIGDLILSIPSLYMVKKMYPEAELVVLVRKYNYEIVKNLPYVDRILRIDDYTQSELLEKIPYFKADVFIALYNDKFISQLVKVSGAKIKIGPISKTYSLFTFNRGVLQKRSRSVKNEAEYNLDLVKKLNPKRYDEVFEIDTKIYLGEENKRAGDTFFKTYIEGAKTLVVNPFIGGSAKNIKDSEYVSLIQRFVDDNPDKKVIVTCHILEEERGEKLLADIDRDGVYLFANGGDLLNIAGIIKNADVYLGASTGPTHIAGALQKRIVAIYPAKATQSTTRWGVFGDNKVRYLIPDKNNKKENYKNPYFDKYDKIMEGELLNYIEEAFLLEEGDKN